MASPGSLIRDISSRLEVGEGALEYRQILDEMRGSFGVSHITYYWVRAPGSAHLDDMLVTTYPEAWVERYLARNYGDRDPVLQSGRRSNLPFDWESLRAKSTASQSFFSEAKEFGIGNSGLSVPVWDHNGDGALFSVTADKRRENWQAFLDDYLSDLLQAALFFHDLVATNRSPPREQSVRPLSRREIEVLEWAARGKSAWETGTILGLSEKTVYFYLRNAADKLGVRSKTQAVARAATDRIIRF